MAPIKDNELGKRIREIRKILKLNQKEFGDKLNISGTSMSEIENGKHKPGFDFLYNLAKVFKVNLYYVFFGKGEIFIENFAVPSLTRVKDFAVNVEYVRDFLELFQQSPTLQLFILNQYRLFMIKEREAIMKEIEENKKEESE